MIKLGYWHMRGIAHPIRYLLEYIEHPYEDVLYEQGNAPHYSLESWTSVKTTLGLEFPELPYMIDQELKLTDPLAIMAYLCQKYAPELIGENPVQMAEVIMIYAQLKDIKEKITSPCYSGENPEKLKQTCKDRMKQIIAYLGKKTYICGENITFVDFVFLELVDFVEFLT